LSILATWLGKTDFGHVDKRQKSNKFEKNILF